MNKFNQYIYKGLQDQKSISYILLQKHIEIVFNSLKIQNPSFLPFITFVQTISRIFPKNKAGVFRDDLYVIIDSCVYVNLNYLKFQMKGGKDDKKANPLDEIKRIQQKREQRRVKMEDMKREKEEKKAYNLASGKNVDIDFEIMIDKNRFKDKMLSPHVFSSENKLTVCVRKRPVFKKQQQGGEIDSISCANPQIKVHEPKYKVDGITKYVENHTFTFDNTFNQEQETSDIYKVSLKPLINLLVTNGVVTCFAYGQTGSGKTFTMNQMQKYLVQQLFDMLKGNYEVSVSFFEIYAGRCLDLLNDKNTLNILQDKSNNIQIQGIVQKSPSNAKELLQIMEFANKARTTHSTAANDTSSRSHSICQVLIRKGGSDVGKLVLVDLAGSQRAQDTQSNNRQRRMQGAQINKSLLALKECIRAMGDKADHVPFRASKLTLILRDSFINKQNKSKVVMIACISPGSSSADHSLNTLRYADRLKDNSQMHKILNQMYQKRSENIDVQNQFSKEHIQKIESLKNIKKDEKQKPIVQNKSSVPDKKTLPPPPPIPNNSSVSQKKKQEVKKQKQKEKVENNRSNSTKKQPNLPLINKSMQEKRGMKSNRMNSEKQNDQQIQQVIEQEVSHKVDQVDKKKIKQDVNIMKSTLKNANVGEEYFAFQEKVTNILQEQEQVFATHMAAIKQDAKLLTQQSQLISKVQGVGYVDFDVDAYVQKLQNVVKKKLKMYNLLSKKIEHFKKCLSEQQQIRHNVKDTFYF